MNLKKVKARTELYDFLSKTHNLEFNSIKNLYQWIDDQNKLRARLIKKVDLILDHLKLVVTDVPAKTIIEEKDRPEKG